MAHIPVEPSYIKGAMQRVDQANTPPHLRTNRRRLQEQQQITQADTATISHPEIQPKALKINQPEVPDFETYSPDYDQPGGNLQTLFALLPPEGKAIVSAAIQEQKILGAPAHA